MSNMGQNDTKEEGPKCCPGGVGYATPLEAMQGPKEELMYVVCVQPKLGAPGGDYLATIDVNPQSPTYQQVIHRTFTYNEGDEMHHSGWNICSSCHTGPLMHGKRDKLILPCLGSDNIYIVDTGTDPRAPKMHKVIEGSKLRELNVSFPHTAHCLASGQVMISTMGDKDGYAKGDFLLLDGNTFDIHGTWTAGDKKAEFGYDFWYQPYWDTMVSTEWGAPRVLKKGWGAKSDVPKPFGSSLNFYSWEKRILKQSIDLGNEGITPLEVRFLHNPKEPQGFVGCAVNANIYRFYRKEDNTWATQKVIDVPAKKVDNYETPEINGFITDILLSLDDKYLYFNNYLHGDVRQYDVSDPANPRLTGQVFLGGSVLRDSGVKVTHDEELKEQPEAVYIKNRRLLGGPQMMQLSLDGKRLYITGSIYSPYDRHFYPDTIVKGSTMVKLDILEGGGMKIDKNFLVDFGKEPNGPVLAHEMRYPGGDCTSDIWLAKD